MSSGERRFESNGMGSFSWNGIGPDGFYSPSGTYFIKINSGEIVQTQKILYLK